MTKKEYNQMIDNAIEKLECHSLNITSRLLDLKFDTRIPNNTYVKKEEVVRAKERIECFETLIELGLIKED